MRPRVSLLLIAVLVLGACSPAGRSDEELPADGGEPAPTAAWRPMPASPLASRAGSAGVWTGRELVVWGGASCSGTDCEEGRATPLGDGAAYDPRRDRWRPLPAAPLRPRSDTGHVWTGREVIAWGGVGAPGRYLADGAAYDPVADSWRPIAASPLAPRADPAVGWTGREMLVWGGFAGSRYFADGAAYDPVADSWRPLAPAPLGPRFGTARWTGSLWMMWGGAGETPEGTGPLGDGAAYDPATDSWERLASAPLSARSGPARAWTGSELLVVGGSAGAERFDDGAAYRPEARRWRALAPYPGTARSSFASDWTGRELWIWGGQAGDLLLGSGGAYDPVTNRWRRLPDGKPRSAAVAVWTGEELLVWGGFTRVPGVWTMATAADGARLAA